MPDSHQHNMQATGQTFTVWLVKDVVTMERYECADCPHAENREVSRRPYNPSDN